MRQRQLSYRAVPQNCNERILALLLIDISSIIHRLKRKSDLGTELLFLKLLLGFLRVPSSSLIDP